MTQLISPDDPRYFKVTSDEHYDRHQYKVVGTHGKYVVVETWEEARVLWWNNKSFLSHVEVLDRKTEKKSKGFK